MKREYIGREARERVYGKVACRALTWIMFRCFNETEA